MSAIQLFQSTIINLVFISVYSTLALFGVVMFFLPLITTRANYSRRERALTQPRAKVDVGILERAASSSEPVSI